MTLTPDEIRLVRGAMDSLGVALVEHDHQWTVGERGIYEEALKVLGFSNMEIHGTDEPES